MTAPGPSQPQRRSRPPWGIVLFLVYAFLILAGLGLSLPAVIDLALDMPVSLPGLVAMALLAYTIFTITLVLQHKVAARSLALGLVTLLIPAALFAFAFWFYLPAVLLAGLAALLLRGLRRPAVSAWLDEV